MAMVHGYFAVQENTLVDFVKNYAKNIEDQKFEFIEINPITQHSLFHSVQPRFLHYPTQPFGPVKHVFRQRLEKKTGKNLFDNDHVYNLIKTYLEDMKKRYQSIGKILKEENGLQNIFKLTNILKDVITHHMFVLGEISRVLKESKDIPSSLDCIFC